MRNPRSFVLNKATVQICALLVLTHLFFSARGAAAQQSPAIRVKHVQMENVSPSDGPGMYANYCAACHGVTGKGDGPAAPAFKYPPTNLTLLAVHNSGKFPTLPVVHTLKFGPNAPAHENIQMPVWSNIFRQMDWDSSDDRIPQIRIRVLTEYIKTLQAR